MASPTEPRLFPSVKSPLCPSALLTRHLGDAPKIRVISTHVIYHFKLFQGKMLRLALVNRIACWMMH